MSNFRRFYRDNNIVFVTIVTYKRQPLLIDNIDYVRNALKGIKYNFKIIAVIVLPDHIHIMFQTQNSNEFSKIVTSFKTNFSRQMPFNENQTDYQKQRREKGIWQRKYYDHIIRNEQDYNKYLDYIHYNSMKHLNIPPKDWKFSSFKKFSDAGFYDINWCNYNDKNSIIDMNLE